MVFLLIWSYGMKFTYDKRSEDLMSETAHIRSMIFRIKAEKFIKDINDLEIRIQREKSIQDMSEAFERALRKVNAPTTHSK